MNNLLYVLNIKVPLWSLMITGISVLVINRFITHPIQHEVQTVNKPIKKAENNKNDNNKENEYSDEEETPEIALKNNYSLDNYKMVLCVNMELKMDKGKIAAQCGHATLGAYKMATKYCPTAVLWWQRTGQAKIAVKVEKESLIYEIEKRAKAAGLATYLVEDAGRTQIAAGSKTVLAIGPAPTRSFEGLTSELKLL
jgi:PTH2 family peptidyl-tRNA hydrolase